MTINSKNTKAEILAAYKEVEKQKKVLESEVKAKAKSTPVIGKNIVSNSNQINLATTNKAGNKNISHTIVSLEQIKDSFGGAVSNLSEQLIMEATQLEAIRSAIALEKSELENLHKLTEVDESTVDVLLEQYQANAKKYAAQLSQQKESDEQEITALKQAWKKEQETHARLTEREREEYRQSQLREKEEYEYNLDKIRDLDEEEYEQEKKARKQELDDTRQTLEKQWQEKETEIAKQEQEYIVAREKVAAFDEQLRAKIKQGTEQGKGIGIYQTKIKADLRTKEIEGEQQNYQLRIESLEQTIKHQSTRISKLSQQLDSSLQQVQDLAVKAIEGTANRNSFEAMKAIAMEQVKTQQRGK